jgi:peroxiredoxin
VLDRPRPGVFKLACFTRLAQANVGGQKQEAVSVRLDVFTIDQDGQIQPKPACKPYVEFEGPDSLEIGYLVQLPPGAGRRDDAWTVEIAGEPRILLRRAGEVDEHGTSRLKLIQTQRSPEWDEPRGDRAAWRLETTYWIEPRTGVPQRVQRTLLGKTAAHRDPTYRLTANYDLESQLRYEGSFFEDRRREIEQVQSLQAQYRALADGPGRPGATAYAVLAERAEQFINQQPATPYRDALLRLREQALASRFNQLPAPRMEAVEPGAGGRLAVGLPAPDFAVPTFDGPQTVGPRAWRGRVVLLAFFHPNSASGPLLLPAMERLHQTLDPAAARVVGMVMTDDEELVRRRRAQFNLTFPLCAGTSLRQSYEVATTPRFVVVDADGRVAAVRTGWGPESAAALESDLRRAAGGSARLPPHNR